MEDLGVGRLVHSRAPINVLLMAGTLASDPEGFLGSQVSMFGMFKGGSACEPQDSIPVCLSCWEEGGVVCLREVLELPTCDLAFFAHLPQGVSGPLGPCLGWSLELFFGSSLLSQGPPPPAQRSQSAFASGFPKPSTALLLLLLGCLVRWPALSKKKKKRMPCGFWEWLAPDEWWESL